jgi:hypothetical protein
LGLSRAALTACLVAFASAFPAQAASLTLPRAQVHFTLEPNGVIDVLERLTVDSPTPLVGIREIGMQAGDLFAAPSIVVDGRRFRAGDGRRAGTFRIARGTRGVRIEWREPRGLREVRIGYRLAERPIVYRDVIDLRIALWEPDWPVPVGFLTASLHLPRDSPARVRVWLHPSALRAFVSRNRRGVRVRARDVGGPLELRAVFPRSVLTSTEGARSKAGLGLRAILAEERGHRGGSSWWIWLAVALVAAGAAATGGALRKARSRRPRQR